MTDGVTGFLELRSRLRRQRTGDGGWDTCAALTMSLDAAVVELAAPIADGAVAVVAVGGYGRGEMCLFSDVDVMILHRDAALKPVTDAVLYPLWDANLKVGHSVRTIKEAVAIAGEDFDTLTSLLTMRCLAGQTELVAELEAALRPLLRKPITPVLVARERERRDLDPYPVMSADLKEGRGGLRTYQALAWERRRSEILDEPVEPDRPERRAHYGRLLAARNALHAAAGRAVDRFHGELRSPAARWLGLDAAELAAQVTAALHEGDRLAERLHPELHSDEIDASPRRSVFRLGRRRQRGEESAVVSFAPTESPLRMGLRLAQSPESAWRGSPAEALIQRAAWQKGPWSDDDRDALVDLLMAGAAGRAAWALLVEIGWMANHMPEWLVVAHRPQLAPFHEHPVGAHLWRTVDEMLDLSDDPTDEHATIAAEVGSRGLLVLAAFLHDIGKGHGGDHSEIGAGLTEGILRRFGFDVPTVNTIAMLTRHHLLLSETATRRDLDDPNVIGELAEAVGDLRTLKALYLLSIADGRATGSGMLTDWKATLLRAAFSRVAAALGAEEVTDTQRIAAAVAASSGRHERNEVEGHIAAMDPSYLLSNTPDEVAWHLDVIATTASTGASIHFAVRPMSHGSRVAVVAADRTGLLGGIATVLGVHGISILGARLFTRADGIVVDVFDVEDDRTHGRVPDDRWERVAPDLEDAVTGSVDLGDTLEQRAKAYGGLPIPDDVSVRAPRAATTSHTVLEVRCADRIGRLAQIVRALYAEGLDVSLAKLDTRAGEVVDTFYVTRNAERIDNTAEILRTVTAIRDRLRSGH